MFVDKIFTSNIQRIPVSKRAKLILELLCFFQSMLGFFHLTDTFCSVFTSLLTNQESMGDSSEIREEIILEFNLSIKGEGCCNDGRYS